VLSETRKRQPAVGLTGWIAATPPGRLHVSMLTLGEIEQGITRVRGRGDRQQAAALERWLRDVETGFEDRVLPVTLTVAVAWGRQQYAQPLLVIDALIAATARVHGMTVVTRNVKDFELAGVQVLNPFTEWSGDAARCVCGFVSGRCRCRRRRSRRGCH
jgi:predicted nucleic acid-binding protein